MSFKKKKKKLVYTARLLPERFYPFTVSLDNNVTVCVFPWSPCWHWILIFKTFSLLFFANFDNWKTYRRCFNLHFCARLWAWNNVLRSKNCHLFCVDVFVLFLRSQLLSEWLPFPASWSLTTAGSLSWPLPISEPEWDSFPPLQSLISPQSLPRAILSGGCVLPFHLLCSHGNASIIGQGHLPLPWVTVGASWQFLCYWSLLLCFSSSYGSADSQQCQSLPIPLD